MPLPKAVRQIAQRYNSNGLHAAVYEKQRPGGQPALDDSQKQRIVAMVCTQPPEGRARLDGAVNRGGSYQAQVGA